MEENIKIYYCSYCEYSTKFQSTLKGHERTHTGEKPFSCKYCDKAFAKKANLQDHERTHTGERPFVCGICNKAFKQKQILKAHEMIHARENLESKKRFCCSFCDYSSDFKSNLVFHERTHTGHKPFICKVCNKAFAQNGALKVHERSHTKEKPYKCNFCEKAFSINSNLRQHELLHTGEKAFKCNMCGKAFAQQIQLKTHKCLHLLEADLNPQETSPARETEKSKTKTCQTSNTKLFKCNLCDKSFADQSTLDIHMWVHPQKVIRNDNLKQESDYIPVPVEVDVKAECVEDNLDHVQIHQKGQIIGEDLLKLKTEKSCQLMDSKESVKQEIKDEVDSDAKFDPSYLKC